MGLADLICGIAKDIDEDVEDASKDAADGHYDRHDEVGLVEAGILACEKSADIEHNQDQVDHAKDYIEIIEGQAKDQLDELRGHAESDGSIFTAGWLFKLVLSLELDG